MSKLLESGENYLETILILSRKMPEVRSIDIASQMNFSKPSVSRAVSILKSDGFITVAQNGHIELTESGREIAEKIYERHKVISTWFMSIGVSAEIALEDACKIEHDLSEETFQKLKEYISKK